LLSFFKMAVAVLWHPFCFITSKKALHYRVVPAVSPSTHALGYLVFPQHLPILKTAVVTALVLMKHQVFRATSAFKSHS
jgi:Mg2+/citrate symporter